MNDRVHFASLLLASHMGVLGKSQLIEAADKRICEVDNPDPWLLELSSQGDSQELEQLIVRGDEGVCLQALRLAYRAWDAGSISDARFAACCRTLLRQSGDKSRWYDELLWVDNEFGLVAQGVFRREESFKKVRTALKDLLEREYLVSFQTNLEAPWRSMKPIRVGRVPIGEPEPNRWVSVERDGNPVARIDVYAKGDGPFTELIVWGRLIVLGLGQAVHLIDPHSQQTWSLECDGYFGHLYPLGDRLLIASASALVCLDNQGQTVWQREHLGIDGVVVEGVEGGIVTGKGEWDPPGGWRPFRLLLATGVPTTE